MLQQENQLCKEQMQSKRGDKPAVRWKWRNSDKKDREKAKSLNAYVTSVFALNMVVGKARHHLGC